MKKNCGEFQRARSYEKIKVAIYQFSDKYLGIKDIDKVYIQKIVLSNQGFFQNIIQDSIKEYAKYRNKAEKQYKEISNWNVPVDNYYSKHAVEKCYKNCIMKPAYVSQKWRTEVGFIENYLESDSSLIDWWFKNGDAKNEIYLGIPYIDEKGKPATFYPDFIVHYKHGATGIFDPKEGQTATSDDTKLKAEALQRYIKENKTKNLFGGIVKPSDKNKKIWTINQDEKYNCEDGIWKPLN